MAKRRQVGGLQETLIQLRARSIEETEAAVKAIRKEGGRVLYAIPPQVIVASLPESGLRKLEGKKWVALATPDVIRRRATADALASVGAAHRVWNEHLNIDRRLSAMRLAETSSSWDDPKLKPLHPPPEVINSFLERAHAPAAMMREAEPELSSPVLTGRIGVGVIFVDSVDPEFQITDEEEIKVISEISEGLTMLSGFEPRAGIEWFFEFKRPKLTLTSSDFAGHPSTAWEDIWRDAAMAAIGQAASLDGLKDYLDAVKTRFTAQWTYAIFVTKYPKSWFAYHWGDHLVLDFQMDLWGIDNLNLIVAHETAHLFGCPDEYASSNCDCGDLFGRFQVPNGNCENCAPAGVACLMKANTPAVCDYTRGHLGWSDLAVLRKGSLNLKKMRTFDFETGVIGLQTGADVWWEHVDDVTRLLVPQNGALLAKLGQTDFDVVSAQSLGALSYSAVPINGSENSSNQLVAGTVIAVRTNSGRFAKMKIKTYGSTLGIDYVTYQ